MLQYDRMEICGPASLIFYGICQLVNASKYTLSDVKIPWPDADHFRVDHTQFIAMLIIFGPWVLAYCIIVYGLIIGGSMKRK